MKIKKKISLIFIVLIILNLLLTINASIFLKNNYATIKYNKAYNYYYQNKITPEQYATYLIDKGFIVTKNKINEYKTYQNHTCHLHGEEIIVYDDKGNPIIYAYLNKHIINDFLVFLNYMILIYFILILSLLLIIYILVDKNITKRLVNLENDMIHYDALNLEHKYNNIKNKDEINSLQINFKDMLVKIKYNQEQKQKLIMALSHELKNPLAKNEAIIDMYKNNHYKYNDKNKVLKLLQNENEKILLILNNFLKFYKNDLNNQIIEININQIIKEEFDDDIFLNYKIKINEYKIIKKNYNEQNFKFIIKNIKSNVYKYTLKNSMIVINILDNKILIKNKITNQNNQKSSHVGKFINEYLANELNIQIIESICDETYITQINLN